MSSVTATAATTASASPAAQPETAAKATAVARQFLGVYSAGQYAASWTLLAPSVQRKISQATGDTAVVTVSLSGAAAAIGSASESLTYAAGRWGFVPADLSFYKHKNVKADIAAAKAAGRDRPLAGVPASLEQHPAMVVDG